MYTVSRTTRFRLELYNSYNRSISAADFTWHRTVRSGILVRTSHQCPQKQPMEMERNCYKTNQEAEPTDPFRLGKVTGACVLRDSIPERQVCVDSCAAPAPQGLQRGQDEGTAGDEREENSSPTLALPFSFPLVFPAAPALVRSGLAAISGLVRSFFLVGPGLLRVLRTLVRSVS